MFAIFAGLCVAFAAWITAQTIEEQGQQSSCSSNLRSIAILLESYHQIYKTLPPAHLVDVNGTPTHSWRALILPMYNPAHPPPYTLKEPWNGPTNGEFTNRWKPEFVCPAAGRRFPTVVSDYAMVVGPGTVSPGSVSTNFDEFTDGRENTVIIIELPDSDIAWGKPQDVSIEEAVAVIGGGPAEKNLADRHGGRLLLLFADGEIRRLRRPLPDEASRALFTISGGERVTRDELSEAGYF